MEAAALYAFATARSCKVICFAHVTNTMGQQSGDDFEKGEAGGNVTALRLIAATASAWASATGDAHPPSITASDLPPVTASEAKQPRAAA